MQGCPNMRKAEPAGARPPPPERAVEAIPAHSLDLIAATGMVSGTGLRDDAGSSANHRHN